MCAVQDKHRVSVQNLEPAEPSNGIESLQDVLIAYMIALTAQNFQRCDGEGRIIRLICADQR